MPTSPSSSPTSALPTSRLESGSLEDCYAYDMQAERDTIAALPEVEAAARGTFRGVSITPVDHPDDSLLASGLVMQDEGIASPSGRYRIIDGADASGATEIVVNEHLAEVAHLEVGDRVELTFWGRDELGSFADDATFHGPSVEVRVTGIARAITDLAASLGRHRVGRRAVSALRRPRSSPRRHRGRRATEVS